ncbi:MAG TPA: glutaredoxin domain-containing protein [Jatrophihabitantaceae bacterium]|nr:glutaredoxin domain-containing protein [Jatrophihabitantaceae bacterium]
MNDPTAPDTGTGTGTGTGVVDVYWRPGYPYCSALRRDLSRRRPPARWHNIWQDEAARSFVGAANVGNETVPTVRVRDTTLTNPRGAQVTALATGENIRLTRAWPWRLRWATSWLPTVGLVVSSELVASGSHSTWSWALDAAAIAAWWLTRPTRR